MFSFKLKRISDLYIC